MAIFLFIVLLLIFAVIGEWPQSGFVLLVVGAVIALPVIVAKILAGIWNWREDKQRRICLKQGHDWKNNSCRRCGASAASKSPAPHVTADRVSCHHDYKVVSVVEYQNTPSYYGDCTPPRSEVTVYECTKCGDTYSGQVDS